MPLSTNGKNTALNAVAAAAVFASLHSGIPDNSGSNEITGGTPAYARKAIVFNSASGGQIDKNASDPVFDVPPATTVYFVGYWSAVTAGTFYGYGPINGGNVRSAGTGANSGDVITSYAHGLVNTDRVTLRPVEGKSLPGGLDATTIYFVVGATTDTFQLSLTSGGSVIPLTTDSELVFQKVIPETFGSQGTLTLDTASIDLNA